MILVLTSLMLVVGGLFALVAALGIVRLPDLFMRMHAATKAGTLGASLILLAAALVYDDFGVTSRAIATIFFLFLTAPIASHVIGRAAYFRGTRMWEGTLLDELEDRYDLASHKHGTSPQSPASPPAPAMPEAGALHPEPPQS
ncbi:hypothetical protein BH23BAC4_BH23BAC4_02780 [soil metagenome]